VFLREENNLGAGFFGGYVSVADVGGGGEVKFYGDCLDFANPDVDLLYGLVDRHKDANPDCNAEFWFGPGGRAESADDFWSPKNRR